MARWLHVVAIVLTAASVDAQTVVQHEDRTLTIRAESVPIATLLSEIARVYPIERVTIQSGFDQRLVSIALERVSPAAALVAILKASGLDFAVSGRRIVAGDWTAKGEAEASPLPKMDMQDESSAPNADQNVRSGRPLGRPDEADRPPDAEEQHVERAAIDMSWAGDETTIFPVPPVPFIANVENITYLEPNFVPYKMRPHVRALRMAIDVTTIP